jgi:hypothetical protein
MKAGTLSPLPPFWSGNDSVRWCRVTAAGLMVPHDRMLSRGCPRLMAYCRLPGQGRREQ